MSERELTPARLDKLAEVDPFWEQARARIHTLTQQVEGLEREAERKSLALIELERHTRYLGLHALANRALAALNAMEGE